MCVFNANDKPITLQTDRFAERLAGKSVGKEILTGQRVQIKETIELAPKSIYLYDLRQ
jgi:hypothetical protein